MLSIRTARWLSLLALTASCATHAPGDSSRTVLGLTFDNDYFTGSDNNYSNGLAITALSGPVNDSPEGSLSRRWASMFDFLPWLDMDGDGVYVGASIGQEIHTPDDIGLSNPPLDDQPYAGIAFVDLSFAGRGENQCTSWNIRLGVVGPESRAEEVQREVHEILDDTIPAGWDTQLPNEPILNVDYNVVWEFDLIAGDSFGLRVVPILGASAGNYFTGASAGAYAEWGWNLPGTVGDLNLRQGVDPVGLIATANSYDAFSLSAFAGGGGFAVGHYLPLDGTVFSDSRSVDPEPLVGFLTGGISLRRRSFALSYFLTFFSERFETEADNSDFGRVTVSFAI